jgi:hypothetical protein
MGIKKQVELEGQMVSSTELAVQWETERGVAWVPRSQISDFSPDDEDVNGDTESIFVPEWLAVEKGLV